MMVEAHYKNNYTMKKIIFIAFALVATMCACGTKTAEVEMTEPDTLTIAIDSNSVDTLVVVDTLK